MRAAWAILLLGCGRAGAGEPPHLEIRDPESHWQRAGFVEMVPPVRPPSSGDGSDEIRVYLRLPESARIAVVAGAGGPSMVFPPGTVADRVELVGGRVVDVRGTRFGEGGEETFHVYRRAGESLAGTEWPRSDPRLAALATAQLAKELRAAGSSADRVRRFERLADCVPCHEPDQPQASRPRSGRPNRRTDASGLVVPLATLADAAPIELHRPRDMNADDRFITTTCAGAPAELRGGPRGARRYVCADGSLPISRLDVTAALAAGDPHAARVCASRRTLFAHLDAGGRRAFASAFRACGIAD
ncbi:MAG TPA: hypothetical protein VKB80_25165 [Kofleriaceae bacterium]|nr:hypothetical protein [Kofleriaceae bacterium]